MRSITFQIAKATDVTFVDALSIEPSGLLRVSGWTKTTGGFPDHIHVRVNDSTAQRIGGFRVVREDLVPLGLELAGYTIEFLAEGTDIQSVEVLAGDHSLFTTSTNYQTQIAHYNGLFTADTVRHRDDIYGSAPIPPLEVNGDILRLSSLLTGRILDFGCGRGGLLRELRMRGLDAVGIEMENELLRRSLAEGVSPYVRFYDGSLPLPFEDGAFDSVVAAEVIEHIPHYEAIVAEIARVAATTFIATVPDISSIPTCFPHYVVPWHLLERDHRNFFTQSSLDKLMRAHFDTVEFFRICPHVVNDTLFYGSLAIVARK